MGLVMIRRGGVEVLLVLVTSTWVATVGFGKMLGTRCLPCREIVSNLGRGRLDELEECAQLNIWLHERGIAPAPRRHITCLMACRPRRRFWHATASQASFRVQVYAETPKGHARARLPAWRTQAHGGRQPTSARLGGGSVANWILERPPGRVWAGRGAASLSARAGHQRSAAGRRRRRSC